MLVNALEFISELEGGYADIQGDRGGVTFKGISSRAYPELVEKIRNQSLSENEIEKIYSDDYYYNIAGVNWMESNAPDVAWLLFIGAIHGVGDEHLTVVIQDTLNSLGASLKVDGVWGSRTFKALRNSWSEYSNVIRKVIDSNAEELANRRAKAVGIESKMAAIYDRVMKEHAIARRYRESNVSSVNIRLDNDPTFKRITIDGIEILIRRI